MADSSAARDALRECEEMSLLIEINSDHLERLRNSSSRSNGGGGPVSELTRQEIRTMEGKLVKHFSKQASQKAFCANFDTIELNGLVPLKMSNGCSRREVTYSRFLTPPLSNLQLALRTRWCSPAAVDQSEDAASVAREIEANYPSLSMFLVVAGVSAESKSAILARVASLEALKETKTDSGTLTT